MAVDVTIRKQKIKVITANGQHALQIRRHLNDRLQYDLIKVLERVFANNFSSNEYIIIDKLKVDVGTVTTDIFEQHFIELIESKLLVELQKLAAQHENISANNEQSLSDNEVNAPVSSGSKQTQEANALLYFLEHGTFPWWYKKEQQQTPETLLDGLSQEAIETLLLNILSIKKNRSAQAANNIINRLFIHLPQTKYKSVVHQLLSLYNDNTLINNIDTLIKNKQEITERFSITTTAFYQQIFQFLTEENTTKEQYVIESFFNYLKANQNAEGTAAKPGLSSVENIEAEINDLNKKQKSAPSKAAEEGIYIHNAGLVFLLPFLASLFKALGLLNEQNIFASIAAQQKAAVLLYYLQSNDEEYKEWEMVFNKIICGIAADDVLPDAIEIAANEKEECKSLLQSIVDYWDALRGASVEALQNTFILREGKIKWKENHWLLQVERTGADILLDKLPWSFSTIKLPWLNWLIYTEW